MTDQRRLQIVKDNISSQTPLTCNNDIGDSRRNFDIGNTGKYTITL